MHISFLIQYEHMAKLNFLGFLNMDLNLSHQSINGETFVLSKGWLSMLHAKPAHSPWNSGNWISYGFPLPNIYYHLWSCYFQNKVISLSRSTTRTIAIWGRVEFLVKVYSSISSVFCLCLCILIGYGSLH